MKRVLALVLAAMLLLSACYAEKSGSAIMAEGRQNQDLLLACAEEMRGLGMERVYAVLEAPEETGTETETETATVEERLVIYQKSSDTHEFLESENLERALREMGFALIFFQTASDGRESVIFSTGGEGDPGVIRGISYSFDGEPVAWWGRAAKLTKSKNRYVEINQKGDAWYVTIPMENGFYYWEKQGSLLG